LASEALMSLALQIMTILQKENIYNLYSFHNIIWMIETTLETTTSVTVFR